MAEFLRLGFSKKDLERLNRVRLYMQSVRGARGFGEGIGRKISEEKAKT
jgi:hypothetical protein